MKVFRRVLTKTIILLLIVLISGGSAAGWQAYRHSTADYAVKRYVQLLVDHDAEKAYKLLDQSEAEVMTKEEYTGVLEAKKYSLYSDTEVSEVEKRRDNDGNEYTDYQVKFKDAAGEVKLEEELTVKKKEDAVLGFFDKWQVLSAHCMVQDFELAVPHGSEVYLDQVKADAAWLDGKARPSYDVYRIPTLLPGKESLTVRHPALESVNTTLNALDQSADFCEKMPLKKSAKDACTELGVKALQQLYKAAVTQDNTELEKFFSDCKAEAGKLAGEQAKQFHRDDAVFKNTAISNFAPQFGELVFTEEANGAITAEMTFSYHYVVRQDVTADTEEYLEDGTPVQQTQTEEDAGDATAKFQMSFYDGEWHIASIELPVIPE